MVMRQWPAKVNFSITYLVTNGPEGVDEGGEFATEHLTVNVEALCADHALRKIKDHYLKTHQGASFKFGPVLWYPAEQIGKVALTF